MTQSAHYDILDDNEPEQVAAVVDALPIPMGDYDILGGVVDEESAGPEVEVPSVEQVDETAAENDFGVGTPDGFMPAFGTHEPNFGTDDDILGGTDDEDASAFDDDVQDGGDVSPDLGIPIPPDSPADQSVLENRPLLNFGGDLPDATNEDQWDFGDEVPAASTEVSGDGFDEEAFSDDYNISIPMEPGDQVVIENRPLLNFGGDIPDATDVDQWDFGDEVSAASTEVIGDGFDDEAFSEDYGIKIPADDPGDPAVVENRPLLNFGGDLPDTTSEEQWDFGDEIPASSTEVHGDEDDSYQISDDVEGDEDEDSDDDDILGAHEFTDNDPAFREYLEREVAAAAPLVRERDPFEGAEAREWEISFGPVWVPAGRSTIIRQSPQCIFRGEKIMATDTFESDPGGGSRITQVAVGNKIQKPGGITGTLTKMFAAAALANGISFDTAQAWSSISVTVRMTQDCTFYLSIFGKAIVDQ